MSAKPFIDTNILIYAFASNNSRKEKAEVLLAAGGLISVQVLQPIRDRYDTDTIKDADGDILRLPQASPSSLAVSAVAPMVWYVGKAKLLGANYGAMVVFPFANATIEAPAFQLSNTVDTSFPIC